MARFLCCLRQRRCLMRGSVPARRDTFLSGKVSKTMALGPRPPAGRVRCDARPIRRVWNSRLRRSDNQTLAPDCPALLAGAKVAKEPASHTVTRMAAVRLLPCRASQPGAETSEGCLSRRRRRVPERRVGREAQGSRSEAQTRVTEQGFWVLLALQKYPARGAVPASKSVRCRRQHNKPSPSQGHKQTRQYSAIAASERLPSLPPRRRCD